MCHCWSDLWCLRFFYTHYFAYAWNIKSKENSNDLNPHNNKWNQCVQKCCFFFFFSCTHHAICLQWEKKIMNLSHFRHFETGVQVYLLISITSFGYSTIKKKKKNIFWQCVCVLFGIFKMKNLSTCITSTSLLNENAHFVKCLHYQMNTHQLVICWIVNAITYTHWIAMASPVKAINDEPTNRPNDKNSLSINQELRLYFFFFIIILFFHSFNLNARVNKQWVECNFMWFSGLTLATCIISRKRDANE